jgi:DNA-binding transcriptional ArsR family regulator
MMKNTTMPPADQPEQPGPAPALPQLLIADLETLRIMADPIRLRILELLVMEPQTVKRLAATLELPQTKLYYHVNLLEEHGLIQVVGTRIVSGIIEKRYGAVAQSYRIDEALLTLNAPGGDDTFDMMLSTLLDGVKRDVRQGLATGVIELRDEAPPAHKLILGRVPLRLTPERAAELHQRLQELIAEYCPSPQERGAPAPGTQPYQLFIACFPTYVAEEQPDQG